MKETLLEPRIPYLGKNAALLLIVRLITQRVFKQPDGISFQYDAQEQEISLSEDENYEQEVQDTTKRTIFFNAVFI